jgi:hypothetical protein
LREGREVREGREELCREATASDDSSLKKEDDEEKEACTGTKKVKACAGRRGIRRARKQGVHEDSGIPEIELNAENTLYFVLAKEIQYIFNHTEER